MSKADITIYEIAKNCYENDNLKNDIYESLNLMMNNLQNKYTDKLTRAVDFHKKNAQNSLSKEIGLINAIKEFIPSEKHQHIESLINAVTVASTVKNMHLDIKNFNTNIKNYNFDNNVSTTIHSDGIYEIDHDFEKGFDLKKNNMPMMMLLMMFLQK